MHTIAQRPAVTCFHCTEASLDTALLSQQMTVPSEDSSYVQPNLYWFISVVTSSKSIFAGKWKQLSISVCDPNKTQIGPYYLR